MISGLNKIILIGRLVKEPELTYLASGTPISHMTLAVKRNSSKDKEGETDFIDITSWNKLAEFCAKYLDKGNLISVEGRLQIRKYEVNGDKRKSAEVIANDIKFLTGNMKNNNNNTENKNQEAKSTENKKEEIVTNSLVNEEDLQTVSEEEDLFPI